MCIPCFIYCFQHNTMTSCSRRSFNRIFRVILWRHDKLKYIRKRTNQAYPKVSNSKHMETEVCMRWKSIGTWDLVPRNFLEIYILAEIFRHCLITNSENYTD